jgi:hypothetical protein
MTRFVCFFGHKRCLDLCLATMPRGRVRTDVNNSVVLMEYIKARQFLSEPSYLFY